MAKLREILIVDIEATCWRGYHTDPPEGQVSDIIEIGICKINLPEWEISDPESIFVAPQRSEVSDFCTELTGITQKEVDSKGVELSGACQYLRDEYRSQYRVWGSWGDYDRTKFRADCSDLGARYPFSNTHLNIKALHALSHGFVNQKGMMKALKHENLDPVGDHHCGADDAYNTARIFRSFWQK